MSRGRLMAMLTLALAGCSFSGAEGDGMSEDDDPGNGPGGGSNMPAAPRCQFSLVDVCNFKDAVGTALAYNTNTTIDTSVAANCPRVIAQTGGPELCVFHNTSLTISADVRVIGTRPIVFVSTGAINITGSLDVSSARANNQTPEVLGAGAAAGACDAFPKAPVVANDGAGGGAGASFGGKGGNGGKGDVRRGGPGGGSEGNASGESPAAMLATSVTVLRGGCRGQNGADASTTKPAGPGGPPGGAIYLAAAGEITLTNGRIIANGGGGRGGSASAGGGGGGSGGMIVLESKLTHRNGTLVANGGGGGEGGLTISNGPGSGPYPGTSGADGTLNGEAALGGTSQGRNDGSGGKSSGANMRNANNGGNNGDNGGGGGGGGAAGFIRIIGPSDGTGTISPPL